MFCKGGAHGNLEQIPQTKVAVIRICRLSFNTKGKGRPSREGGKKKNLTAGELIKIIYKHGHGSKQDSVSLSFHVGRSYFCKSPAGNFPPEP